jgi:hypothetical protein
LHQSFLEKISRNAWAAQLVNYLHQITEAMSHLGQPAQGSMDALS